MRIAVAGGKGGTGKTLLATCMAEWLAGTNPVLVDVDVEEPNAALFIAHSMEKVKPVYRKTPWIDLERCDFCGKCADICEFNALVIVEGEVLLFPELCHSCQACHHLCPQKAISLRDYWVGQTEAARIEKGGRLVTGRLKVGEARSLPVIAAAKEQGRGGEWEIIDCPPGTSCPVMEALQGCDGCLLVTEATPFGVHDLSLALEGVRMLHLPVGLVINRWQGDDSGLDNLASKWQIPILARIPYDADLASHYARGLNPLSAFPWLEQMIKDIFEHIRGWG